MSYDNSNIFAKILRGEIPSHKVFETEHCVAILDAFLDSAPAALFTVGPSSTRYPRTARQARAASGAGMVALVDPSGLLAEQAAARRAVLSHAVAALLLACKFHEVEIHAAAEFAEFASICMESLLDRPPPHGGLAVPYNDDEPQLVISVEELVRAESRVCEVLELDMAMPVASEFLFVLLQRLRWPAAYSVHRGAHARERLLPRQAVRLGASRAAGAARRRRRRARPPEPPPPPLAVGGGRLPARRRRHLLDLPRRRPRSV